MAMLPGTALADGKQNFSLLNKTGYTISEVYVAPSKSSSWEEDILGRDVLPDGTAVDIVFSRKEKSCKWDLKVIYDDGEEAEWDNFDLCTVSKIAISYNRKSGETWATYE
ncbi:argininosuccinate lyase [Aerophototrophica crusticola]|uniref:Argininosuccinate lyase n=1 Tax=Aerophototrophica crusticola TaxID=1709002 RepID=A0A858R3P5_9PROT|nr:argininosuccinate lyase [Rhodospirillaceae bacterium B3]